MSTSSNSSDSKRTEFAHPNETPYHHECVEMLITERTTNTLVMSSVLDEMALQARTTHRPVILMNAPNNNTIGREETSRKS